MIFYVPLDNVRNVIFLVDRAPQETVATGYCVEAMILRSDTITDWPFSVVTLRLTAYVLGRVLLDTFVSVPLNNNNCSGKPPCPIYWALFHSKIFDPRTRQVKNISWLLYATPNSLRVLFISTS